MSPFRNIVPLKIKQFRRCTCKSGIISRWLMHRSFYTFGIRIPYDNKVVSQPICEPDSSHILLNKKFNSSILKVLSNCEKNMSQTQNRNEVIGLEDELEVNTDTSADLDSITVLLNGILETRKEKVSSWIIERKVKQLCGLYRGLSNQHKQVFLHGLAMHHAVDHTSILQAAQLLLGIANSSTSKLLKAEEQLKRLLMPHYLWLFFHIGKIEKGVKFLVDLRTDVLDLITHNMESSGPVYEIQQLNTTLQELLSMWFSIGFLKLERITWHSSCEMLQKISKYEVVHPIRNWVDLKRRVGAYRRCFIFTHASMPGEPLVVLHTALSNVISSNLKQIVASESKVSDDEENPENIKAAVFYSVTSTQKGLQGIELGNYLIKSVVQELQIEFPQMTLFSSLSPIPSFRNWLLEKLKKAKGGCNEILFEEEVKKFQNHLKSSDIFDKLTRYITTNSWVKDSTLADLLEAPLMRLCARYLYLEKKRGYALDSVANFHLKNGAVMWRLNWNANLLPRGLTHSCGIMVNYRYFLEETEMRSRVYLEKQEIAASNQVIKYSEEAKQLITHMNSSKL